MSILKNIFSNKEKEITTEDIVSSYGMAHCEASKAKLSSQDDATSEQLKKIHSNKANFLSTSAFLNNAKQVAPNVDPVKAMRNIRFYIANKSALENNVAEIKDYPELQMKKEDVADIQSVVNISSAYKNTLHKDLTPNEVTNRMAALVATTQIVGYVDDKRFQALAGGYYGVQSELNASNTKQPQQMALNVADLKKLNQR